MKRIPLAAVPNQKVAFNVDGAYWQLHVYQALTTMCCDVNKNGVNVISGMVCSVGVPLLPYDYMRIPDIGNFVFDGDLDWNNFGATCYLNYMTAAEYEVYRAALYLGNDL